MDERRYSDQEFARIMEASAGTQPVPALRALQPRTGLTLAEMQAIAAEVGIRPEVVARVTRALPVRVESEAARLFGGPATFQMEFALDGEADEAALGRVLDAVRRATAQQGEASLATTRLEWSSSAQKELAVNVTAAEGRTRVMIISDRSTGAAVTSLLAVVAGGVAFGVTGAILEPTGVIAIGAMALGIAGTAAATARTVWAASTRRCRTLLARLTTAIADTLESQPPAG